MHFSTNSQFLLVSVIVPFQPVHSYDVSSTTVPEETGNNEGRHNITPHHNTQSHRPAFPLLEN